MRILFISNLYPPNDLGGLEQRCQEVAERLKFRGHKLRILSSHSNRHANDPDDEVIRSLFLQSDLSYYRPVDFFLKYSGHEQHNIRELRQCMDDFVPDVILVWGMWNLSRRLAYYAEQWLPGRVAYNIASYWPIERDVHETYWRSEANRPMTEWLKRFLRYFALRRLKQDEIYSKLRFEHAFCASEFVRNRLRSAGVLSDSSCVIYPGIDPDPLIRPFPGKAQDESARLRLLYFGSLVPHKGVHTAIEALGLLRQRGFTNRLELTILGSGHPEYEKQLHDLTSSLNLEDQIIFIGKVARKDIPMWLNQFDIFLFTSIWPEPIAATVMEAMVAGLLVIGTEVGGQVEMLSNGVNSLTFQPGDAAALANHLVNISANQLLMNKLARAGQEMALSKFTLDRMVDEIEAYLTKIAQPANTAGI